MAETITTRDGDMVDQIAFDRYGYSAGAVEAILLANRGLAAYGPSLPAGLVVVLPAPAKKTRVESTRLWT
jgi:phage tail protein X